MNAWIVAGALLALAGVLSRLHRELHMLQLDGYRLERYVRHSVERLTWLRTAPIWLWALLTVAGRLFSRWEAVPTSHLLLALGAAQVGWVMWDVWSRKAKVPLARTARMSRLAGLAAALAATWVAVVAVVTPRPSEWLAVVRPTVAASAYGLLGGAVILAPVFVMLAALALEPFEAYVRRSFIDAARRRLAAVSPLVIGIAGSYGKTTTKAAVAAALSGRFRVYATPDSYNTLLGVTRAINEGLADDTEVFVVEMGARQVGDIVEICELVRPEVGIVTRLGPQHLEYFKDAATVVRAKTELLRALPADGVAVVDADGIADFLGECDWQAPTTRVSSAAGADAVVEDVAFGGDGTTFSVVVPGRPPVAVETRLLGRHAAANCALAVVVAQKLGLDAELIRSGLAKLQPVPHRLEIVRNDTVVVIDDAFSSNPEGFVAALEVLQSIPGRRILITPGMVELGEMSVPVHRSVGAEIARACDVVILVGRSWPAEFMDAILAAGLPVGALHGVASLGAASELLAGMIRPGDVVLFENDLPDNFA